MKSPSPSRNARAAAGLAALLLGSLAPGPARADDGAAPRAEVGIGWVSADALELVGWAAVELRRPVGDESDLRLGLASRLALSRSLGDFTFAVRDVEADFRAGWGRALPKGTLVLFAGHRGIELLDEEGEAWFRYVGARWESPDHGPSSRGHGISGSIEAAAIVDESEVAADAFARGEARLAGRSAGRLSWGIDVAVDALWDGERVRADLTAGPRLDFPAGVGRAASLFARWVRGRHPFGLRIDGVVAGIEIEEDPARRGAAVDEVDLSGLVAGGAGDGGAYVGRLLVRARSPEIGRGVRAAAEVDANLLTAPEDRGDLYVRYHLGVERPTGRGFLGAWFHHRSNHVLAEPNPTGVTSVNVLEVGHDSTDWDAPPSDDAAVVLDWRIRAGALLDSAFGEEERWHVRGGLRAAIRRASSDLVPFAQVEGEAGDVGAYRLAVGTFLPGGSDVRLEWARDDQWFRSNRSVVTLSATVRF